MRQFVATIAFVLIIVPVSLAEKSDGIWVGGVFGLWATIAVPAILWAARES